MANTEMLSHGKWSNQSSESISEGRMVLSSLGGLGWGWKWWVWSQAGDREINHSLKINAVNGRICWANRSSELLKGRFFPFFILYSQCLEQYLALTVLNICLLNLTETYYISLLQMLLYVIVFFELIAVLFKKIEL